MKQLFESNTSEVVLLITFPQSVKLFQNQGGGKSDGRTTNNELNQPGLESHKFGAGLLVCHLKKSASGH